jgi:hypothetical protein
MGSGAAELEPMGSNAGAVAPLGTPPADEPLRELTYPGFASASGGEGAVDGMRLPYGVVMSIIQSGAGAQCPNNDCSLRWNGSGFSSWNPSTGWKLSGPQNARQGGSRSTPGLNQFASPAIRKTYGGRPWAQSGSGAIEFSSRANQFAGSSFRTMQNLTTRRLSPDEVSNIRPLVEEMLNSPGCSEVINDLFNKMAVLYPNNPIKNRDVLSIFDKIQSQDGFFYENLKDAGGEARGTIRMNNARVISRPPESISPIPDAYQVAETFLNEVLHHVGEHHGFNDIEYASALGFEAPSNPDGSYPPGVNKAASGYWHPFITAACRVHWTGK